MRRPSQPVSKILKGAWRAQPDPVDLPKEALAACLPVLTSTGAGGLAWNRIKGNPDLATSAPGEELHTHAQMLALEAARHEMALSVLAQLLHSAGIAPLHFKGWAAAQSYGTVNLRAMGDVDLCAPPGRFDMLSNLLRSEGFLELTGATRTKHGRSVSLCAPAAWPGKRLLVDLHERLDRFFAGPLEEVFARARPLGLGESPLLIAAPEDHLRIVTIHFLSDGGWRPSALCDVGAMLEGLPDRFDWELCLGAQRRQRRWLACTFELAHELLGARLAAMPAPCRALDMPPWFRRTVLRAWEMPASHHLPRLPFRWTLRRYQSRILTEALARWPNGIRATVELESGFTRLPRWPYQVLLFVRAVGRFALQGLRTDARDKRHS